jgi:membrane fusion protein, heavy metal efflux system
MSDDALKKDADGYPIASPTQLADTVTPDPSVLSDASEESQRRFRFRLRLLLLAAVVFLALTAAAMYRLWPRHQSRAVAVEKPPTVGDSQAGGASEKEAAVEVSEETARLIGIKTEEAVQGPIEETIAAPGRVLAAPNAQAVIGAKVDGRAVRVLAEPGQFVSAGQVLVVVDSTQIADLRGQLTEARARSELAEQKLARVGKSENRSAVIQAKNQLDLAQATLERKRRLVELGAVAGREVAEAETQYKNAKAEYDYQTSIQLTREHQEAASEVTQAHATIARLTQSLSALGATPDGRGGMINVTSPIAGAVVDRHVTMGQTVTPDKELLTIMNVANVIIEAQLPESQARRIRTGQWLSARIPGPPGPTFEGQVNSVGNTVDPVKRTVAVRAGVPNTGALLKHEMAVEVRIVSGGRKDALLVPISSLVDDEGIKVVYVKEGNRYERRPVEVGTTTFQLAEILSGVKAGEEVVTAGAYQLKNVAKGGGEKGHDDDH